MLFITQYDSKDNFGDTSSHHFGGSQRDVEMYALRRDGTRKENVVFKMNVSYSIRLVKRDFIKGGGEVVLAIEELQLLIFFKLVSAEGIEPSTY